MQLTHETSEFLKYLKEKLGSVISCISPTTSSVRLCHHMPPIVVCCPEKSTQNSDGYSFPQHPHAWLLESRPTWISSHLFTLSPSLEYCSLHSLFSISISFNSVSLSYPGEHNYLNDGNNLILEKISMHRCIHLIKTRLLGKKKIT
jgi:hypothetical protein